MSRPHLALPVLAALAVLAGCKPPDLKFVAPPPPDEAPVAVVPATPAPKTLPEARARFGPTKLKHQYRANVPVPNPPADLFDTVKYDSPVGKLAAYVTPKPKDGKRHPAIIWLGADCNTIGDVWSPAPRNKDHTARQYREAGVVMMFPSLRGGNDNPGAQEYFYGEVDDVIAAAEYLAKLDHVDPDRIYLGGHGDGATLALLVAASAPRFRAVFCFGPADTIETDDPRLVRLMGKFDADAAQLRSPAMWVRGIRSPAFVFGQGLGPLGADGQNPVEPKVHQVSVFGKATDDLLAPVNELIAKWIIDEDDFDADADVFQLGVERLFEKDEKEKD